MRFLNRRCLLVIPILALALATGAVLGDARAESEAATAGPGGLTLDGGNEGSNLGSLLIEGEDELQFDYERPRLDLGRDLMPRRAPGLDWANGWETVDDFSPLVKAAAFEPCPQLGRPWLHRFAAGDVARFAPRISTDGRWTLTVVDSRGEAVRSFSGKGEAPEQILWDGRDSEGEPVTPGLTYSIIVEARDRAGNLRSYTGEGFDLPPFLLEDAKGLSLVFAGNELRGTSDATESSGALLLAEAASRLNQGGGIESEILIRTEARSVDQARLLGQRVAAGLSPRVAGAPDRVRLLPVERDDAPDRGTVLIQLSR